MGYHLRWFVFDAMHLSRLFHHEQDPRLRPRIWKILLAVNEVSADTYLRYLARGPCDVREKIQNDTFRYDAMVSSSFLQRLSILWPERWLLTVVSKCESERACWFACLMRSSGKIMVYNACATPRDGFSEIPDRQETQQLGFTYVQGMNVLAAPFLYTMPSEVEAFFCFSKFIEESCPLYVQPTLEGVHRGLKVRSHSP
jgi:cell cycle arrest protein BUB2